MALAELPGRADRREWFVHARAECDEGAEKECLGGDRGWRLTYRWLVSELRIAPGPGMSAGLVIPDRELIERFSHASGPGGQGVNTADSRVQLSYDVAASSVLDEVQRDRLLRRLSSRLDGSVLTIVAAHRRSQRQNRVAARERLVMLLRDGIAPPAPPRRASRPTRGSIERRLATKKHRGEVKRRRGRPEAL